MIEVDISKLDGIITSYEEYIKQMDKNNLELMEEFNGIKQYWHDQKCINMYSSFELEKKRIIRNAENIKSQLKLYKYIRQQYKALGEKIRLNLNNYDNVIEKINAVRSELKWIINRYDNLDYGFYPGAYRITNQRNNLQRVLDSFNGIKEDIVRVNKTATSIENNIQETISSLDVEVFSLNNYESEV